MAVGGCPTGIACYKKGRRRNVRVYFRSTVCSGYAVPYYEDDRIDAVGRSIARRIGGTLYTITPMDPPYDCKSSTEIEYVIMLRSGRGFRTIRAWF